MSGKKQWIIIVVAAVISLGGGIYIGIARHAAEKRVIATLYATSLLDLESRPQAVSQWKNKTLLINYWATWCDPCREEVPALIKVQARNSSKNLQIVGIALDSVERVQGFAKTYGINYPLLIGGMGIMDLMHSQGNDIGALPFTLVVSPGGAKTRIHLGPLSEQQMESLIEEVQAGSQG